MRILIFALTKRTNCKANTRWCLALAIALQIVTVFVAHSHHHYGEVSSISMTGGKNSSATSGGNNKNAHHQQHQHPQHAVNLIDILSIGSIHRPQLQDIQEETFGSHAAVRRFVRITELDDVSDPYCHSNLTLNDVKSVSQFCRRLRVSLTLKHKQQQRLLLLQNTTTTTDLNHREHDDNINNKPYFHLKRMTAHYATFRWLSKKENPTGWMCAQKRPIDGLAKMLTSYDSSRAGSALLQTELPEYLIVVDDDTWMNLDLVLPELLERYPASSQALAVAGCRIRSVVRVHNFTIPFGGWGIILTRAALENLMRPITCATRTHRHHQQQQQQQHVNTENMNDDNDIDDENDDFVRNACRRILQDNIGEGRLFTNGMTVLNLMQAYAKEESYLQTTTTTTTAWVQSLHDDDDVHAPPRFGYCLHSDWAWGYWLNFYNIAIHSTEPIITTTSSSSTTTITITTREAAAAATTRTINTPNVAVTDGEEAAPYFASLSANMFANVPEDRLRAYQDTSTMQAGERTRHGQCLHNGNEQCTLQAHICHYVNSSHMQTLHQQQQQQQHKWQHQRPIAIGA